MLEGKPLLSVERQEVEEQEAKERFVGRLIVLVLGVSPRHSQTSFHIPCFGGEPAVAVPSDLRSEKVQTTGTAALITRDCIK